MSDDSRDGAGPETDAGAPEEQTGGTAEETVAEVIRTEAEVDDHHVPGTVALTIIFLLTFAVYYFANWKALADVWHVR